MAQKVVGLIKLQIAAGKATPAPPVGPALGQHGVNIMAFTKEFNERTKNDIGLIIPVVITVYADRSSVLKAVQAFLTRLRLVRSLRIRSVRSLKQRCLTLTQLTSTLL